MVNCSFCGRKIEGYSFWRCHYCGEYFCGEHRLPENHNCIGVPRDWDTYREERAKRERRVPVREFPTRVLPPIRSSKEYKELNWAAIAGIIILIAVVLCAYLALESL